NIVEGSNDTSKVEVLYLIVSSYIVDKSQSDSSSDEIFDVEYVRSSEIESMSKKDKNKKSVTYNSKRRKDGI
ncbi:4943_t:CDS:2, partial [Cetraspora pellucida]